MLSDKKKTARRAAEALALTSYWKTLAIKPPPAAVSSIFFFFIRRYEIRIVCQLHLGISCFVINSDNI
ncbi:hypothetical protein V6N12_016589 [Hibiscus sabdariffa]|uniref:Uncharacterized protein n=1 Tax=Hibiscus sabdariffa TaxID=183260 RepID=A0ABR2CG27_9ROSI